MNIKEAARILGITEDTLRYYERVGAIPPVNRTSGGIRDYQESELDWIRQTVCFRKAGLSIEALVEYRRLFEQGEETIAARLELLKNEEKKLIRQRQELDAALERLNYKISRYEEAVKTGHLSWSK